MTDPHTSGEQRRSELTELRRELRDKQSYLNDDSEQLWAEISRWLLRSYNAPVGSLRTMVRSRLAELQEDPDHKMYDHPNVDRGEEAFPDACKGCPHYGVQCPVLARHVTKQTYQRIFEESDDDDELQGQLSAFAAKHHCHVIQNTISDWESGYADFLSEGERLRMQLNADIKGIDVDQVSSDLEGLLSGDIDQSGEGESSVPTEAATGTETPPAIDDALDDEQPPEEVSERIEQVTESIMAEDADEAES